MKKEIRIIAAIVMMILCVSMFIGCMNTGTDSKSAENEESENDAPDSNSEKRSESIVQVIAVTGSKLEVLFYMANSTVETIDSYYAVDLKEYTAAETTSMLAVADDVEIFLVSDDTLDAAALSDVSAGNYLVVTHANGEAHKIVILNIRPTPTLVAKVTDISENGVLSLIRYTTKNDVTKADIWDYANLDLEKYEATEETGEYQITKKNLVYLAENGVLSEATFSDIEVGDMLLFYYAENEQMNIAIYHTSTDKAMKNNLTFMWV